MKLRSILLTSVIFLLVVACNNEKKDKAMTIPASTDKVVIIQHPVADFDTWKPFYQGHDSIRKAYGLTHIAYAKGIDDPNQVIIFIKMEDESKAKEFTTLPDLKDVMQKAGVTGQPSFDYLQVLRNDTMKTDINDRVLVKHKVKDFDTWLKVYDDEGMEKRKTFGLIDRALARGLDDPNMVYILFAVSDWDKANGRMNSEELKKIMTDAGVEGPPTVVKYRRVE